VYLRKNLLSNLVMGIEKGGFIFYEWLIG